MNKTNFIVAASLALSAVSFGQVVTTNRNPVGLEHNLLFNATTRYTVTQTGSAPIDSASLFDGKFEPAYSEVGIVPSNPTVITIEGLPACHTQIGTIVGWSTRYWPADHFKIEAYNVYAGANQWVTVADYTSTAFSGSDFNTWLRDGAYSKLRFTFYSGIGDSGRFGVSELFFLHPEATSPYDGLFTSASAVYSNGVGNVGIGTTSPTEKLSVNGKIRAKEVIVDTNWSDYVFTKDYRLASLSEVEQHIEQQGHLPGVPSAKDVAANGVSVGDMQAILLAKIEELTLHQIAQEKKQLAQEQEQTSQRAKLAETTSQLAEANTKIEAQQAEITQLKAQTK